MSGTVLVLGLGLTGRAVAEALIRRGEEVRPVDDRPEGAVRTAVSELGLDLVVAPGAEDWPGLLDGCDRVVVSPGVSDAHPIFEAARLAGVVLFDESDLAADWDARPRCAVTGTDGKTTVVTLVAEMLERSGIRALSAGNNETPMVAAIDDAEAEVFVVEASSFRLGHAHSVRLGPAVWLNFAPDHLDIHADLGAYEAAKARIWESIDDPADAVANLSDPVVRSHAPEGATGFGSAGAPVASRTENCCWTDTWSWPSRRSRVVCPTICSMRRLQRRLLSGSERQPPGAPMSFVASVASRIACSLCVRWTEPASSTTARRPRRMPPCLR